MDSFEINKIVAAILMVALLVIGIGKVSDLIFYVKKFNKTLINKKNFCQIRGENMFNS